MFSLGHRLERLYHGVSYQGLSRRVLALLRPYWRRVLPVLCLQGATAVLGAVGASLVLPLLQVIAGGVQISGVEQLSGMARAYARWISGRTLAEQLQIVAAAFVAIGLVRSFLAFWTSLAANHFTMQLAADLRLRMLDLYLGAEYQFFLDRKQGRILNDLNEEPARASVAVTTFLNWWQQLLTAVCLLGVLLALSWPATLVSGIFGLGLAAALAKLRFAALEVGKDVMVNKRSLSALGAETISGIRQIKLFGAESHVWRQFASIVGKNVAIGQRSARLGAFPGLVGEVLLVALVGLIFVGLSRLFSDRLTFMLPTVGAFFIILRQIMPIVADLSSQRVKLYTYVPALDFILGTLREVPSETASRKSGEGILFHGPRERITFEDVTFAYQRASQLDVMPTFDHWMEKQAEGEGEGKDGQGRLVLQHLNIVFERGRRTALVGSSGGGKSTVVDLLARLFDPQQGRIAVDGVGLRDIDLQSWRAHIGYVSQDTFIFHGTIRENIAFSKPGAAFEEVERAARIANAHEFILELPESYDTVVGDRGMKLSGGQRQRIAIARAILRDPPILIFDEATSSLDMIAERAVQAGVEAASRDRTVIIITHRLSSAASADVIYVMEQGQVVEKGSHQALLEAGGAYHRLYEVGSMSEAASASASRRS